MDETGSGSGTLGVRPESLRVSARAVVIDEAGRVLLIRHQDDDRVFHVLPGGRIEDGETAAEAVEREVLEETGLRIKAGDVLWVREFLPDRHIGSALHRTAMQQLQLYFAAELTTTSQPETASQPDRTQQAAIWHPADLLEDLLLLPEGLATPLTRLAQGGRHSLVYLGDLA